MYNNILTYLCFITICGLLVTDMWLSTNIVLQILCIVLALLVVVLVTYIAFKHHKGTYMSNELQTAYKGLISDNIALTNELNHIKQKAKQTAVGGVELQQIVLTNKRLTAQITNLKTHLQTVSEQLQTAKNQAKTVVLPITPNEQKQTASNLKKSKTA
jgi:membrane glycosyltransferase